MCIRDRDLLDEKILKKKIAAALYPKQLSLRPFAKDLEGIEIERVEATIGEVGVSRAIAEMLEPTRV